MRFAAKSTALALALLTSNALWAETFTYQAVTDFENINAGEVPYYRHNGVNALAINAAIEEYRDKFGRATTVFENPTGTYDVTITALGETDGDGEFRFLVDGEVLGAGINEPTNVDFQEQLHTFENITISEGALIAVESIAVSNGLIPEGDAYAYARGRWTRLTIESIDDAVVDPVQVVDLALSITPDSGSVTTRDLLGYSLVASNLSDDVIATNAVVTIAFPPGFSDFASDSCIVTADNELSCELTELAPGSSIEFGFSAENAIADTHEVTATVNADQPDSDNSNNTDTAVTIVTEPLITVPVEPEPVTTPVADETIDLAVLIEADNTQVLVGDQITYTLTLANNSTDTAATTPILSVLLPASLQFQSSDICTAEEESVRCETEELPAGTNTTVSFTALTLSVDSFAQLFAIASSSQPDSNLSDNEVQLVSVISTDVLKNLEAAPIATAAPVTTAATTTTTENSGGGSAQFQWLLALLMAARLKRILPGLSRK